MSENTKNNGAKKRIIFLCTGNSGRSQLAEGIMRHFRGAEFEVFSAGTAPRGVNPKSIGVLYEIGIDASGQCSKHLDEFKGQHFDFVVTLCDSAAQNCPAFYGGETIIHHCFSDPDAATGTDADITASFRLIRDQIKEYLISFNGSQKST
ncbi:MAG: arsenate reductase ArsC [bacterium]|nr:arsenate reductase ArsC [bacterium]